MWLCVDVAMNYDAELSSSLACLPPAGDAMRADEQNRVKTSPESQPGRPVDAVLDRKPSE